MYNSLPALVFSASTLLLLGCGQQADESVVHEGHAHGTEESAVTTTVDALPPVALDNGQRWKANPETTTGIARMAEVLGAYDPAAGDPQALKGALEEEFGLIFERCTMTGEAHEQLHNYLLPIHHQLRDFEATEAQRAELAEHLAAYGTYFE